MNHEAVTDHEEPVNLLSVTKKAVSIAIIVGIACVVAWYGFYFEISVGGSSITLESNSLRDISKGE